MAVFATSHSSAYDDDPGLAGRRFRELQAQAGKSEAWISRGCCRFSPESDFTK